MFVDRRLFNTPRYYLYPPEDYWMLVPQELLTTVVFLGRREPTEDVIGGTAFFVAVPYTLRPERKHVYLVTARHSIDAATDLFARINAPADRGTFPLSLPDGPFWITHPGPAEGEDYVDLAATRIPDSMAGVLGLAGYRWMARSMFFDEALLGDKPSFGVGIGDEVVTLGLLTVHYGQDKNEPVVRTGNLAMVPSDPVLVRYGDLGVNRRMRLYLTELRSIAGLSGSPVFVRHRTKIGGGMTQISLLGLMIGHWDDGDRNHMGFGKVVPARLISEVIDQEDEVKRREEDEKKTLAHTGTAVEDSAFQKNESEFERFERLAKELATTPKPEQKG